MLGTLRYYAIIVGLILGFSVAEAVVETRFFSQESLAAELFHPSKHQIVERVFGAIFILFIAEFWRRSNHRRAVTSAELRASEKLYRDVVENCPDSIIIHRDNKVLFLNRVAQDYLDLTETSSLQDLSLQGLIHVDDQDHALQRRTEILSGANNIGPTGIRVTLPDGRLREATVSSMRIVLDGEPAVLTFCRDVTDERATRRDLAASQERLSLALDAAQDGVWDWDMVNDRLIYNTVWAEMLGLAPLSGEQSPEIWAELAHPDDEKRANEAVAAHVRGETANYQAEVRLRHSDGHDVWILDRGKVVERAEDGTPLRMTGTHRDITDRKRAEIALEIRNNIAESFLTSPRSEVFTNILPLLGNALESPAVLLGIFEPNQRLQIAFHDQNHRWNPGLNGRYLTLSELPEAIRKVVANREPAITNSPLDLAMLPQSLSRAVVVPILSKGKALGFVMAADRAQAYAQTDVEILGSLTGYLAPILEFHIETEISESQLRQAQKMEAVGALAGGIAHDFNNILQAILGFSTLALEEARGMVSQQGGFIANDLERVVRATQRGKELVNRILLFSRRQEQEQQAVNVAELINEVVGLLANTIPATIEVRTEVAENCGAVLADPAQISQVLMNLATNSFHAMEQSGGTLQFGLRPVADQDDDMAIPVSLTGRDLVVLTVTDTGCGIDATTLDRLFDPFFTTKDVDKGTGLGLSMVHGIVTDHGGDIVIESSVGQGTSVHVFLPVLEVADFTPAADQPRPQEVRPLSLAVPGRRILFLDDEPDIAALGKALLEKQGHHVVTLLDSRVAINRLRQAPADFDLLITDMTMPHMTGTQLAAQVAQIRPELPIVLITGLNDMPLEGYRNHPQIKGVLRKPFGGDTLRETVERVLRRGTPQEKTAEQGADR